MGRSRGSNRGKVRVCVIHSFVVINSNVQLTRTRVVDFQRATVRIDVLSRELGLGVDGVLHILEFDQNLDAIFVEYNNSVDFTER